MKAYYDRRAPEYDDWYLGTGHFGDRDRPGWNEELAELQRMIAGLEPGRVLDVACGTGFLTRHLRGDVVGLDQSKRMLDVARRRCPKATFLNGDALALPFPNLAFHRVFFGHFYGHLEEPARRTFLDEARRVARELVVVDSALREDVHAEEIQERILEDGSRHEVYKRYFTAEGLAEEIGGGVVLHAGRWFAAVQA